MVRELTPIRQFGRSLGSVRRLIGLKARAQQIGDSNPFGRKDAQGMRTTISTAAVWLIPTDAAVLMLIAIL